MNNSVNSLTPLRTPRFGRPLLGALVLILSPEFGRLWSSQARYTPGAMFRVGLKYQTTHSSYNFPLWRSICSVSRPSHVESNPSRNPSFGQCPRAIDGSSTGWHELWASLVTPCGPIARKSARYNRCEERCECNKKVLKMRAVPVKDTFLRL